MITPTLCPAPPAAPAATAFETRLQGFAARYRALWQRLPSTVPALGETYSQQQQRQHEAAADRHLATLERLFRPGPPSKRKRHVALIAMHDLAEQSLGYSSSDVALLFGDHTLAATRAFVDRAQAFAPALPPEDLFQALRNLWVMHGLQLILGLEVATTPAVFAYSMLYPLTDNVMDDERDRDAKEGFSARLGRRLRGEPVRPANDHEADVFKMVALIEAEHSRAEAPEVWASLLAIQRAQIRSLSQQGWQRAPDEVDVLGISIEKGGSSVLADGYLVARTLSAEDAAFIFGFGVVLQLLDDLQDTAVDRAARHMTLFSQGALFSQAADPRDLEALTSRLGHLLTRVLAQKGDMAVPSFGALMQHSCTLLLLYAVAQHRELMSPAYTAALEAYSPLRLAYMAERRAWVAKRYGQLRRAHPGGGLPHPLLALLS